MFENKKILKEIGKQKNELEREKQELLFIKQQLDDTSPKINISNVYVWEHNNIYSLVYLNEREIIGKDIVQATRKGYNSTLTDIFTNNIVFEKNSIDQILYREIISSPRTNYSSYAYLHSIYDYDKNLLAFTDKKVPKYLLQQLLYKLNKVDVKEYVLKINK